MIRLYSFAFALLLGALPLVASVPIRPVPTPSLADQPTKSRQMIEEARRAVETARRAGESVGPAYGRLGSRYLHAGLLEAALVALENAVEVEPEEIRWRYYLAVCHERRGEPSEAVTQLRRVLARREGNLPAVLRLGNLLAEKGEGEREEALKLFQAALQSPLGLPAGRAGLARLAELKGDNAAAMIHLEAAIEAQPAATALRRRLSHVLAASGRQADAARELRQAGDVEVRYPDPLMLQLALEMGDPNVELQPAGGKPAVPDPDPRTDVAPDLMASGSSAFLDGDRQRGLELLEEAVEEAPSSLEARQRLASALLVLGRVPEALPHLERAVAIAGDDRTASLQLAQAYFELQRLEAASAEVEKLLAKPTAAADYEARILSGQIAAARQNPEVAEQQFRRVAESVVAPDGLRSRAFFNLGLLNQASRRIEEAVTFYGKSLDLDPNQRQALFNLGLIMASNDRHAEAIDAYQRLFDLQPENADVRFRLAVSLMRSGQHWPALGHFEALLKETPDDVEAIVSSSLLLDKVGQGAQARDRLEAASKRLEEPADQARILGALGGLQRARGGEGGGKEQGLASLRRALAALESVPEASPEALASAHLDLARALAQDGFFGQADDHFAAYLATRPDDEKTHFARAMALILGDRDARARDVLVEVTTRLPSVPLTHLLARLLAGSPEASVRQGERAVEIARTVFERERNPFHGETLAMALAAAGRFEDAITMQNRLLEEARAADFDADFIARVERNLIRYQASQPGLFGW